MAEELANVTVAALTPADMVPAQTDLIAWTDRRIAALRIELDEFELHQQLAYDNGWKTSVVNAAVERTKRRITYYEKMHAALAAGYLLVPNMPCDVLAVRVDRARPPRQAKTRTWGGAMDAKPQAALPAGEGHYVDDSMKWYDETHTVEKDGKDVLVRRFVPADYDEIDFPIDMAKPVLGAAAHAMALKVFDQIGLVQTGAPHADPILIGQLLDPRGKGRRVTFFIGWYVNTADL